MSHFKYTKLVWRMGPILACWSNPIAMQAMINTLTTGWGGDNYAMVQRQKLLAQSI